MLNKCELDRRIAKPQASNGIRISVVGSGVVGRTTGLAFSMLGNEVIFHDMDSEKLVTLKGQGHKVTKDISEAVCYSNVSFICVQTPLINQEFDFSYLESAAKDIALALRQKAEYHVVAVRSTVCPFATRSKIIPILEEHSKLRAGEDFGVCMNPEFLRQETALQDFLDPSRIVIGELDKRSGDPIEKLYAQFKVPIFRTDIETAEMIKYVANCFLATKISFFNEIYIICRKLGLDPNFISEVVSLDPRIGKYGVYGGRPFGGDCLPKDLQVLINFVEEKKLNPQLLTAVLHINKKVANMQAKVEVHD